MMLCLESTRVVPNDEPLMDCVWVAQDLIAFLKAPRSCRQRTVADVWSCASSMVVTELSMTEERLEEVAHGSIVTEEGMSSDNPHGQSFGMELDEASNCLVISSKIGSGQSR